MTEITQWLAQCIFPVLLLLGVLWIFASKWGSLGVLRGLGGYFVLATAIDAGMDGQLHPALAVPIGLRGFVVMTAAWRWAPRVGWYVWYGVCGRQQSRSYRERWRTCRF